MCVTTVKNVSFFPSNLCHCKCRPFRDYNMYSVLFIVFNTSIFIQSEAPLITLQIKNNTIPDYVKCNVE